MIEKARPLHAPRKIDAHLIEVIWVDIQSFSGWRPDHLHEEYAPAQCRSVGYLYGASDDALVLCQSIGAGDPADLLALPWSVISRVTFYSSERAKLPPWTPKINERTSAHFHRALNRVERTLQLKSSTLRPFTTN